MRREPGNVREAALDSYSAAAAPCAGLDWPALGASSGTTVWKQRPGIVLVFGLNIHSTTEQNIDQIECSH